MITNDIRRIPVLRPDSGKKRHSHTDVVRLVAPYERALTLVALAERATVADNDAEATALLTGTRPIYIALDTKPALARADVLAASAAVRQHTSPAYSAPLPTREVEVLSLLAAGRMNSEIADMLFLSVNTVRIRVAHILQKTSAGNRVAAAFAQRHCVI